MQFPSKKDGWITGLLWGVSMAGVLIPAIVGNPLSSVVILPLAVFLLWFWFKTDYRIMDNKIKIRYGPIRQTVPIEDIRSIRKMKSRFAAAPALSSDRIQIDYSKYDLVRISPENEEKFIKMLLEINPDILVDQHLKKLKKETVDKK
ncbi:PH domain-containing protein [Virgibacillus oceani]